VAVLHDGIAEHQKLHPGPSVRIITREAWDKKAADSPSAKAPPKAKQSKKTRQTKPAKVVAPKRKSRSTSPVPKGRGKVGVCKVMGDDCVNKSSPNQTTKCSECTIWVHPKKGCSIAKGTFFVCVVCWNTASRTSQTLQARAARKSPHLPSTKHRRTASTAAPLMTLALRARRKFRAATRTMLLVKTRKWRRIKPPWLTLTMKTVHPKEGASIAEGFAPPVLTSRQSVLMTS